MRSSTKYLHLPGLLMVFSIAGIIGPYSIPLVSAEPALSLAPSSGHIGETVSAKGTGFTPLASVEILFNGTVITTSPANVTTSLSGEFEAEFVVPGSETGNAIVTARETLLGNSTSAEFTVLNDAPVAENIPVSTEEDSPLEIQLAGSDTNGDSLIYTVVQNPEYGTLTGLDEETGIVTYVPNTNYYGDDSFTFKVNDGSDDSNIAAVSISISPVNDPPSTEHQELSVNENGEVSVTLTGSDPDGDNLTFSVTEGPQSGTLTGDPPNLVYRPSPGFSGSDSFSFVANDGEANSNVSQVNVTVQSVNDAPVSNDQSLSATAGESIEITLTGTDPDGDGLTFIIVESAIRGTLGPVLSATSTSMTIGYTPNSNYIGSDSFTFRVSDGARYSNTATVSITIRAQSSSIVSSSSSDETDASQSSTSVGSEDDAGTGGSNTDNTSNDQSSNTNSPSQDAVEAERTINDRVTANENAGTSLPDGIPGQAAIQSLATDTVESNPFLGGPLAWLLPGAIVGVVSVVALLGYRNRRLKKGDTGRQKKPIAATQQPEVMKANALEEEGKSHSIQDRIAVMVNMNKIYRILDDENGKAARERLLDVEYNRGQLSRTEFENNRSIVKNQFEQIGAILRSNLSMKDTFFKVSGELTVRVWWAIKQDVSMDRRRGQHWESLEWLGSEAEKYWSTRSSTSSQAS